MSLKSGWCIDEVLYMDLDKESYAARLHSQCNRDACDCPNHELTKCVSSDTVTTHIEGEE